MNLRHERVECFGKLSVGQPVSFQRAGKRGLIGSDLRGGSSEGHPAEAGQHHHCDGLMTDEEVAEWISPPTKRPLQFPGIGLNPARRHSFPGRVECPSQQQLKEPAVIELLLVIPPVRDQQADRV